VETTWSGRPKCRPLQGEHPQPWQPARVRKPRMVELGAVTEPAVRRLLYRLGRGSGRIATLRSDSTPSPWPWRTRCAPDSPDNQSAASGGTLDLWLSGDAD
jgi:hypothetical protein